ncbi:MAG: HAMP domain-containing histidine kinase [Leptolyngbya sp. SIO4C1]|nr:HAMP domain-containing histidine kinase [Leptolyngbya sp. SIO4C1]
MTSCAIPPNSEYHSNEHIVLSAQPGPNAIALQQLLEAEGFVCVCPPTSQSISDAIQAEAALLVITEDMLATYETAQQLIDCLNHQPEWSDIPVIALLKDCKRFPACLSFVQSVEYAGSLIMLETPLKPHVFISVVQACLQNRRRQYALRDTLHHLRESNQTLESFSHVAAHELRNPLGVLSGSFDLLLRNPSAERRRKLLLMGQRTAKSMDKTLSALLEYGKLKAYDRSGFTAVNVAAVFELASHGLASLIASRNAQVSWSDMPVVQGDEQLLLQLVSNLIKNAIIYNTAEVPVVSASVVPQPERWRFYVIDNGPGISAEDIQKIFTLFGRGSQKESAGSGIGLALCCRIVRIHQGTIGVESQPGQGSRFYFELPRFGPSSEEIYSR